MLSIPPFSQIKFMEEVSNQAQKSRYEREVEDMLREAAFTRQSIIVVEAPRPKGGLRALIPNIRAFLF